MTPSKETIAAALRLADCCNKFNEGPHDGGEYKKALSAYRATLPKLRTRAEVDAEIATFIRVAHGAGYFTVISGAVNFSSQLEKLCDEPTRDDSGASETDKNGDQIPTQYQDCGKCRYPTAGKRCADEWCERHGCCGWKKKP